MTSLRGCLLDTSHVYVALNGKASGSKWTNWRGTTMLHCRTSDSTSSHGRIRGNRQCLGHWPRHIVLGKLITQDVSSSLPPGKLCKQITLVSRPKTLLISFSQPAQRCKSTRQRLTSQVVNLPQSHWTCMQSGSRKANALGLAGTGAHSVDLVDLCFHDFPALVWSKPSNAELHETVRKMC